MQTKWDYEKLDKMTNEGNEFTNIKLNYRAIANYYEEIVITTRKNGDVIPLEFDDVKVAYKGNPLNDITLPEIPEEYKQQYNQLEKNRKVMHIKHFSRDLSHEEWFNFIDNEVFDFIEKYPQFSDIIIEK